MPFIQLQFRRDTSSNWTTNNPTLAPGEMGIETNTNLFKIGTGALWSATPYGGLRGSTGSGATGSTGVIQFSDGSGNNLGSTGLVYNTPAGSTASLFLRGD
jgi:hypothetical protein